MTNAITSFARKALIAAALIGTVAMTGCSSTASSTSNTTLGTEIAAPRDEIKDVDAIRPVDVINRSKDHVTRSGEVYLMRGLANIFSRGIDDMADKMRARGFDAANFSYKYWKPIAQDIVARAKNDTVSYPVIIMGHSLGGNESSKFANYLAANGVKVELVVTFDPVETGRVGGNIGEVVNYYLPMQKTDNRIHAAAGFEGELKNIDVTNDKSITHTNVEKNAAFQSASIKKAIAITSAL
jgi:outer membrane murein-binding lipoprotein Lpp